jgi:hypothetical protein
MPVTIDYRGRTEYFSNNIQNGRKERLFRIFINSKKEMQEDRRGL